MTIATVDVVLPAGGRIEGEFARQAETEIKALIRFGDETVLARTIRVLRETGRIGRIVVTGPEEAREEARKSGVEGTLDEGATGPENVFRGLEWLQKQDGVHAARVLILTTDLPFLSADALTEFLDACPPDADIALPVVNRAAFETRFPDSGSVFAPLQEGEVTLGCAFQINPQTLLQNKPHLERVFAARKNNLTMLHLLGPIFILRHLTKRLAIRHIEERCQSVLNCTGKAVRNARPELAFDIDLPEEYEYARRHRKQKREMAR